MIGLNDMPDQYGRSSIIRLVHYLVTIIITHDLNIFLYYKANCLCVCTSSGRLRNRL